MKDAEKDVFLKQASMYNRMEVNDADSVNEVSIYALAEVMEDIENDFLVVQQAIAALLLTHSQDLGQDKVAYYEAEKLKNAAWYKDYRRRADQEATLVMRSMNKIQKASSLDQNLTDPNLFQSQKLQFMKQENEIFDRQES